MARTATGTAAKAAAGDLLPRGLLISIGILVLVSLVGTAAVRWSGTTFRTPDAGTTAARSLRFADAPDGAVIVIDAAAGREIARFEGEQGFLRGTLRAMARERKRSGIGAEAPFELLGRADGRLTLVDPATGQRIDLEAFGPTNAAVFARLLQGATAP